MVPGRNQLPQTRAREVEAGGHCPVRLLRHLGSQKLEVSPQNLGERALTV